MKVAIVHDYLIQMGGAERVVAELHAMFPDAPIYTSVCLHDRLLPELKDADIRTSFLQFFPFMREEFRIYFLLYPLTFTLFDLSGYDVIISSSSAYAKGIRRRKGQFHLCYCHTPMRFAWRFRDYMRNQGWRRLFSPLLSVCMEWLRRWDRGTTEGIDVFIANSSFIAERIRSIYGRDSVIIYPPVDTGRFKPAERGGNYFLIVSRLLFYKRIDIAVEAFTRAGKPLKIVGEGPAESALKRTAGNNIEFLGRVPDTEVKRLFAECRALVFPGEEDFGITPVEAAASGRPTIAYRAGGALETVIDGVTGVMFDRQTADSLADAVVRFESARFDPERLVAHARKFDRKVFRERIRGILNENKIL
ncbi:MAG TPA: glycosyltransferase [Candidatus Omnitrophota bacterium]|nr:glycosyltransferase [Candidatus Omnitrophota bacterium]